MNTIQLNSGTAAQLAEAIIVVIALATMLLATRERFPRVWAYIYGNSRSLGSFAIFGFIAGAQLSPALIPIPGINLWNGLAGLILGPTLLVALIYLLKLGLDVLGQQTKMNQAIIIGGAGILVLIAAVVFVTDGFGDQSIFTNIGNQLKSGLPGTSASTK